MKKKISLPIVILICVFCSVITFQVTYIACSQTMKSGSGSIENDKLALVDRIYRENYVNEINENDLTNGLIEGYLAGAGEKYGYYLTSDEYKTHTDDFEGNYVGIGVTVVYDSAKGLIKVVAVSDGSPAEKAGIKKSDYIYAVDGESAYDLGYNGTLEAVKGKAGTEVTVTVLRESGGESTSAEYKVTREALVEQTVYYRLLDGGIAFIRITSFNSEAAEEFSAALDKMRSDGATGLIIDLRDNPGGELNSAVSIIDPLIPEGDLVVVKDKDGNESVMARSDANEVDLPMAVLVNGHSASASELFAQSIRDYGKGVLVGGTTYGKFTMQSGRALPDGSVIYISTHTFSSKSRESYEGVGLTPDIEATLGEEAAAKNLFDLTDDEDTVLQAAVKYIKERN